MTALTLLQSEVKLGLADVEVISQHLGMAHKKVW